MALSPGLIAKGGPKVCKLLKSFYVLKQASRQWFFKLSNALIAYGFGQENSYCSLFIKASNFFFITLLVYVDDVILTSDIILEIQKLKAYLHDKFTSKI